MKKWIVSLLICAVVQHAGAQQRAHYTQYILNQYILNPALTGIENYTDVKISGRDQWVGLNGAPRTMYLSVHKPIGKKDLKTTPTSYNIPGENPRGRAYWEDYTASAPHHGIGLLILNDRTGLFNRFTAQVSYAYHIGLSPTMNLAAGFAGGISRIGFNAAKAQPGVADPGINGGNELFKIRPDISAGLWLYSSDYFVGLSAQQIIPQQVAFADSIGTKLVPHLFATAGYRFFLNDDINAIPSVMVKYVQNSPTVPQFDLNLKLQYHDLLWVGGSYRFQDGYAGMLGVNVGNTFNVGYAYDFTTTNLNTASRGTHELIIGFLLGNRYGDTCPRNVW
jgi:type IX secretion system PorP/SprF family membrane protein